MGMKWGVRNYGAYKDHKVSELPLELKISGEDKAKILLGTIGALTVGTTFIYQRGEVAKFIAKRLNLK